MTLGIAANVVATQRSDWAVRVAATLARVRINAGTETSILVLTSGGIVVVTDTCAIEAESCQFVALTARLTASIRSASLACAIWDTCVRIANVTPAAETGWAICVAGSAASIGSAAHSRAVRRATGTVGTFLRCNAGVGTEPAATIRTPTLAFAIWCATDPRITNLP